MILLDLPGISTLPPIPPSQTSLLSLLDQIPIILHNQREKKKSKREKEKENQHLYKASQVQAHMASSVSFHDRTVHPLKMMFVYEPASFLKIKSLSDRVGLHILPNTKHRSRSIVHVQ